MRLTRIVHRIGLASRGRMRNRRASDEATALGPWSIGNVKFRLFRPSPRRRRACKFSAQAVYLLRVQSCLATDADLVAQLVDVVGATGKMLAENLT
jgi:hypothetical protein